MLRGTVPFGRVGRKAGRGRAAVEADHGPSGVRGGTTPPRLPQGVGAPRGTWASYDSGGVSASGARQFFGVRSCLRKGCGGGSRRGSITNVNFGSRNARAVARGWQAAKRHGSADPNGARQRHSEAERQRRKQRAGEVQQSSEGTPAVTEPEGTSSADSGAWSRSRRHPKIFCDRPGCYESPRDSPRAPASYCGDDCRAAFQARDRERKWLRRKTEVGRFKRRLEYQAAWAKRRQDRVACGGMTAGQTSARSGTKPGHPPGPVLFYRRDGEGAVDSQAPTEVIAHDPQRTADSRPRPPPAS